MNKITVNSKGTLSFLGKEYKCAIGKNGVSVDKKEGDGTTPIGCFPIRRVFYRADKVEKPVSPFETIVLTRDDGWCDEANDLTNQATKIFGAKKMIYTILLLTLDIMTTRQFRARVVQFLCISLAQLLLQQPVVSPCLFQICLKF